MVMKFHFGEFDKDEEGYCAERDAGKIDVNIETVGARGYSGGTHLLMWVKKTRRGLFAGEMSFPYSAWVTWSGTLADLKKSVRGGDYFLLRDRRLRVSLK